MTDNSDMLMSGLEEAAAKARWANSDRFSFSSIVLFRSFISDVFPVHFQLFNFRRFILSQRLISPISRSLANLANASAPAENVFMMSAVVSLGVIHLVTKFCKLLPSISNGLLSPM